MPTPKTRTFVPQGKWLLAPLVLLVSLFLTSTADSVESQSQVQAEEYAVKAVFLYNFGKFVDWPNLGSATDRETMALGILGKDPFGRALDEVFAGKTLQHRPVEIRRLQSVDEADGCHILFISSSESKKVPEILKKLAGLPILTVGESQDFVESGGMIEFAIVDNKVRFEINAGAAGRSRLKISSRLLSLATDVRLGDQGEGVRR